MYPLGVIRNAVLADPNIRDLFHMTNSKTEDSVHGAIAKSGHESETLHRCQTM